MSSRPQRWQVSHYPQKKSYYTLRLLSFQKNATVHYAVKVAFQVVIQTERVATPTYPTKINLSKTRFFLPLWVKIFYMFFKYIFPPKNPVYRGIP